jgi:arginine/lysine/ornithine decarboxylase
VWLRRIAEILQICRHEGVPLLVDEAHGGHLSPMDQDLAAAAANQAVPQPNAAAASTSVPPCSVPLSAVDAGADLVMHSTHKVLTAMTQAAMLHLNKGSTVNLSRVSKVLQVCSALSVVGQPSVLTYVA